MNNFVSIATCFARASQSLQPILKKHCKLGRSAFIMASAGVLALTSCTDGAPSSNKVAPMVSFTPSNVKLVKRSPRQLLAECNVNPMFMPKSSPQRQRSSRMNPRFITMHNTENPSADAMQHARALNNGALKCNWHYTVDSSVTMQHIPLNETGRHADRGRTGDRFSIGIEMCEKRGQSIVKTFDRAAKLVAYTMYDQDIPLRNVVPHYYWTSKRCPHLLLDNDKPGFKWAWFISRVDYYYRCIN